MVLVIPFSLILSLWLLCVRNYENDVNVSCFVLVEYLFILVIITNSYFDIIVYLINWFHLLVSLDCYIEDEL